MKPNELSIVEAHEKLVRREVSCTELVQSCLDQIHKFDPVFKVFITVCKEEALQRAKAVDEKIANGQSIGLLEGIPFSAKDVILTEDVRTTGGSNMLGNFIAPYDATVIARLKEAGAILIGKTNCDAYGHGSSTENSDFFVTRNPWDRERISGGSSGGAAAAVSMDMCIFALGEDTGGSIRQPAAMCGVTGLKVSYGRVSRYGSIAYASSLDTIGPLIKTIEDTGIVLGCIAGIDEKDHTTVPNDVPDYRSLIKHPRKKLKIGMPREYFTDELDKEVRAVILEAVEVLRRKGHEIREVSLPYTKYAIATYYLLAPAETSTNLARLDGVRFGHRTDSFTTLDELYKKSRAEGFGAEAKRRIMVGTYALSAGYFDAYYKKAQKVRTLLRVDFDRAFEEVDLLITPTSPFTAFKVGEKVEDPLSMYLADIYTIAFSLAGLPTISIPCGFLKRLPVGMQITGKYLDETTVLQAAEEYQQATSFHAQKPPLPA